MTVYALLLFISPAILIPLAFVAWRRRPAPGVKPYIIFVLAVALWAVGYAFELLSTSFDAATLWSKLQYFGIVTAPTTWLIFVLQYTGRGAWLTRRRLLLLFVWPTLTVALVLTDGVLHHLIWTNLTSHSLGTLLVLDRNFGPAFWVHATYSYSLLAIGTFLLIRSMIRSPQAYRGQIVSLLVAAFVPWAGNAIYLAHLSPIDLTPYAFTITGVALAWGFFRYRLLDIVPIARDTVVESMSDAVIVLDSHSRIVDLNQAAQRILGQKTDSLVGQPMTTLFANWPELVEQYLDQAESHAQIKLKLTADEQSERPYEMRISSLTDQHGQHTGLLAILRDITERQLTQALTESESRMRRRAHQLQAMAEVAQAITAVQELDELLPLVSRLISEQFDFYHVGVFLLDESGRYAVLRAANSPDGQRLLLQEYTLEVDDLNTIGRTVNHNRPLVISNARQDALFIQRLSMPFTRSLVTLPLKTHERIVGVLDIQSSQENAVSDEDVTVLSTLAAQVAVAIDNARLFEQQTALVEENQRLLQQAEANLKELDELNQRLSGQGWEEYLGTAEGELVVEDTEPETAEAAGGLPELDQALQAADLIVTTSDDRRAAAIPIVLRGEVIGSVGLEDRESNEAWTEDDLSLIREVTTRMSLALDNARLFEEARLRAQELSVLNELAQTLTAQLDVNQVLEQTYQGIKRLMDATNFLIGLYNQERNDVTFVFNITESAIDREIVVIPADQGISGYILRTQSSVLIKEDVNLWLTEHHMAPLGEGARSWLGVPLLVGGQVLGVMALQSYTTPYLYDEHDQDLLLAFANQAAIAIQNARLFEQTQRDAERERTINRIAGKIRNSQSVEQILQIAAQELRLATQASRGVAQITLAGKAPSQTDGNGDHA